MLFFTRFELFVAFPASISALTVVQQPPRCVRSPDVPFDGSTFFCGGNSTLMLINFILLRLQSQTRSFFSAALLAQGRCWLL